MSRFRVKLVLPHGPDAHYFHTSDFDEAKQWRSDLIDEIPAEVGAKVWIYVDTSLGHVRVA